MFHRMILCVACDIFLRFHAQTRFWVTQNLFQPFPFVGLSSCKNGWKTDGDGWKTDYFTRENYTEITTNETGLSDLQGGAMS